MTVAHIENAPPGQAPGTPTGRRDLVARLRGLTPSLVPSQRRVATCILRDPASVAAQTISELARAAQTSETTVLRLCHELGLKGYRDLRVALATESGREQERADGNREIGSDIGRDDDLDAIIATITYTDRQAIADTARILDRGAMAEAVRLTAGARRVDIVGVGASAVVALDLQQKLHRIGLIAYAWHDTHAALTAAALLGPSDVVIGVSHSGATLDTIDAIREAGARGARTIALTSAPNSPLAGAADVLLTTADRETTFRSGATASRIAALSVVDVLFVAVAQRRYDQSIAALDITRKAVASRRVGIGNGRQEEDRT
ncbi:MurR/RpiR family transcriptional regulator (plasmid) [Embleya sp. NBC_00888]|uniref:MurR/RpiR family transcriptional regulator n=1 Tax=Embleya sp. NBC_00888 TaxID=2975960 RepID=UPI002F9173DD|nr:MurR/RpiR family transcriptional regulator [Embleya sp. NBC_00888]